MYSGVDGLLRDKTRPPGIARTADEKVAEVIHLTQEPPQHEATHWTIRAMGKALESLVTVTELGSGPINRIPKLI